MYFICFFVFVFFFFRFHVEITNTFMYKVIFDKTDASKSHAIAFDEKAKYPGLAKNADGSCAQYGYDKYPGFVYCMPAASFVEYLTQTAEINFEY